MYKGKHEQKHSHIHKRVIVIIAIVMALLFAIGGVLAKYVYDNSGVSLLPAKEFYFTSNLLTEKSAKYVLNSRTTEISFTLGNNADKLRFSQDDITYSVAVECKNGESAPTIVYADSEQVLAGGGVNYTTVTLEGLTMGETYIVTATGKAGYKQTLKAEFTVSDKEENIYMHLDTSDDAFVLLTVWTENVKGTLTIEAQKGGLIPDNTDPVLREVYNYQNGNYEPFAITDTANYTNAYSSYTYRFFISDGASYSINDFSAVIENNGTTYPAEEKIPT